MQSGASLPSVISHWSTLMPGLEASPKEFYSNVEAAVKECVVPGLEVSRVDWKEGGILSAGREYLRVTRGRLIFDICAAPFGNGFFFSWWLATSKSPLGPAALFVTILALILALVVSIRALDFWSGIAFFLFGIPVLFALFVKFMNSSQKEGWDDALVAMPLVGSWYERVFRPDTYYKIDTATMFQEYVRLSVNKVIDGITSAKGMRALTDLERKPIMRDFMRR